MMSEFFLNACPSSVRVAEFAMDKSPVPVKCACT
jgi:hypothetical protein